LLALIGFVGLAALVPISREWIVSGERAFAPAIWTLGFLLYPLTGLAAWLVWRRIDVGLDRKRAALRRWGWQLLLGGLWPAALYGAQSPALAGAVLALLLATAAATVIAFRRLQRDAALLLGPYCAWLICTAALAAGRFWPGAN